MLTNQRLIEKMTLAQKVKLVTSINAYESSAADEYEFPVFALRRQPLEGSDACVTRFPSDKALAATFNRRLIGDVYGAIGEETKRTNNFGYFNSTDDFAAENLSGDYFLTAKFLVAKMAGLKRSGQPFNFEKTGEEPGERTFDKAFVAAAVLADADPTSILVKNAADVEEIEKSFPPHNAYFGMASSVEEAARLLLAGCLLVFVSEDFIPELVDFLSARTEEYRKDYRSFRDGRIGLSEFDRRVRSLEIFNEDIIDKACDRLISLLFSMKESGENVPAIAGLNSGRIAKFDERAHDALALRAARESVVLVKNDGILPLTHKTSVAVAGEYANDFSYQKELFGGEPTAKVLPFEKIENYDALATTGYVMGYARGESGRADLIDSAIGLGNRSDCVLVYLCAGKGEKSLPPEQLELIDALSSAGIGMIAVVACDEQIDLSFADKCRAVLVTYDGGQEGAVAVLDIIAGTVSPSGKLPFEAAGPDGKTLFPLGRGLSYTEFEYRKFRVNSGGVSFTVANTGACDGWASVQLYVRKENAANLFSEKTLRGFAKVFVKKGDAMTVKIAFDENTFKTYDDAKGCYVIEGGEYEIAISEDYATDKLVGTITLADYAYRDEYKNELVETSDGTDLAFPSEKKKRAALKSRNNLSFGVKLFLAIVIGLYYNALIAVFAFTPLIAHKTNLLYLLLGALAGVFDLFLLIYIIMIAVRRKKHEVHLESDVLTGMIERIGEFKEVAKVTYETPVQEEEQETEESEEDEGIRIEDEGETEEPPAHEFDARLDETEEEVTFAEKMTLAGMCDDFREFAFFYGVNIENHSVRALISAMAASKIVILSSANAEVLPAFLEALGAYFGRSAATETQPDWKRPTDLLCTLEDDKYVVSDFTNAVYGAGKTPAKICATVLTQVNAENFMDYFGDFVDYAIHPTERHEVKIGEELTVRLPDNMTYFIVPAEGSGEFPKEVINASMSVDLVLGKTEKNGEGTIKNVALAEFEEWTRDAREEFFLPETIWKKLDELVGAIRASEKFELGNKEILQIEKLTSAIMGCGGDEAEAFTQMFLSKLVPLFKATRLYRQDGGDRTLFGMVEKIFSDEDLEKIKKVLLKSGERE